MELKEYQKKTLDQVRAYLEALSELKAKNEKALQIDPEYSFDFVSRAWEKVVNNTYRPSNNGIGEPLPDFYVKIPTGGGKTIIACHIIELINRIYLNKQTGMILWIVPTSQIYRQTLTNLKKRDHPYRQVLDIASGGRVMILEKTDGFTKVEVAENLLVMMLMLPSANRQIKEVLKIFKDSGAFADFFPKEYELNKHKELLERFPNLDYFGGDNEFFEKIIKTSLGNTLKIQKPIVIIDEGHKAYSEGARKTIRDFNPSIIVELSATPPKESNILINISGQELNREEMIKLDLHITNKASPEWKDTMLSAVEKRNLLQQKAKEYESNTSEYIRPLCLIQVERTGKDQIGAGYIHAEDVKEYLIKQCGIPAEEVAIKSSEKDDIEGIDLLSKDCRINYIITKQALQEGWDCAFAYLLTILTNPNSQLSITQLVGRILRQPKAKKTNVKELDESYVFCFRPKAKDVLENVKKGFEEEGLGDLSGRLISENEAGGSDSIKEKYYGYRERFNHFEGKIYLPKFIIQENSGWRNVSYEMDILSRINWTEINVESLRDITLSELSLKDQIITAGVSDDSGKVIEEHGRIIKESGFEVSELLITQQIMDIVPNPWIAYNMSDKIIRILSEKHEKEKIGDNLTFIIEELRKHIVTEVDRLAEQEFKAMIEQKILWFFLLSDKGGYRLPPTISVKIINNREPKRLVRDDNTQIERSLFEFVEEDKYNDYEKSAAVYLDEQENLLWWYRNLSRQNYFIQGWKRNKIYPDFVFTNVDEKKPNDYSKVCVIETKGKHLKNEDTDYKIIFALCNELGEQKDWNELNMEFADKQVRFQVIFDDEWKKRIADYFKGK
jgi:type III restriction enzyme